MRTHGSYLQDWQLRVKYRSFVSKSYVVISGVPQGSNFGSLLFLLYIKDIVDAIHREKLVFGDDFKLFSRINTAENVLGYSST